METSGPNGNRARLAAAFHCLRARTQQQRHVRAWATAAAARRDTARTRAAFDAIARGSRSRAAAAAAAATRARAGLSAWRRATALARAARALRWRRDRAVALEGFRRWRRRSAESKGEAGERGAVEWRLELFRERRAKRVVLRAWYAAAQTAAAVAAMEEGARRAVGRSGVGRTRARVVRACDVDDPDELEACRGWGARLRNAEVTMYVCFFWAWVRTGGVDDGGNGDDVNGDDDDGENVAFRVLWFDCSDAPRVHYLYPRYS